jgi:hypothetical protein
MFESSPVLPSIGTIKFPANDNTSVKAKTIALTLIVVSMVVIAGCSTGEQNVERESAENGSFEYVSITFNQGTPGQYSDDVTVKVFIEDNVVCYWSGQANGGMGCVQNETLAEKYEAMA